MGRPGNDGGYETRHWTSGDGLKLAARDYLGGAPGRPAVICLPGLTRNARDYAVLAERLSPAWHVIAVDFRGRGKSEYAKDPMSYLPATYAADVTAMLDAFAVDRFVAVGTSLGGIVTMLLAPELGPRIAGAVLNDVGPELDPAGLGRIRGYVGRGAAMPTWLHAARALSETQGHAHPGYVLEDWLAMAKRLYRLNSAGRVVLDYDMKIAEPFRVPGNETAPDLWAGFKALAQAPLLVVRGELSDVLPTEVAAQMAAHPGVELVEVTATGHAPTLDEPAAAAAIDRLLARVAEPVAA
ncbi:MAG: alpha/beta hydrolase [Pseudomonadota bacterium]